MPRHRRGTNLLSPMIKEIKYSGITTNPSDYECTDGTLSANIGLLHEDGALRPINRPKMLKVLTKGTTCTHIHNVNGTRHYITQNEKEIGWIGEDFATERRLCTLTSDMGEVYQISSIGNTLVVLTSSGTYYFLWKGNTYKELGNHLPELSLSFGLSRELIKDRESFIIRTNLTTTPIPPSGTYSDDLKVITDDTMPHVNKFIAEQHKKGKFIYPFFVRYAYRLYDGSLTMHSSPILMITTTGQVMPIVICDGEKLTQQGGEGMRDEWSWTDCKLYGMIHEIDFAATNQTQIEELEKWSDIITSVEVFISQPLYTFDQSEQCEEIGIAWKEYVDYHLKDFGFTVSGANLDNHQEQNVLNIAVDFVGKDGFRYVKLPTKRKLETIIRENSLFYHIKTLVHSDIKTSRKKIDTSNIDLTSLTTREVMSDDYDSHSLLIAKYAYVYNSRLQLADLSKIVFQGYDVASIFPECSKEESSDYTDVEIYYYIKQLEGEDLIVRSTPKRYKYFDQYAKYRCYLYYPDTNAYKAIVYTTTHSGNTTYVSRDMVLLEPHPMLNGAVYFKGFDMIEGTSINIPTVFNENKEIPIRNKIYTSETNNPFYFPVLGINTVGAGRVIAISSASKALSTGQFGQFPLYAFTDEGVWALEVSNTGTYSAKQPITRDVCLNKESILQLDGEVIFATKRGLMLLSGSNTTCITDNIIDKKLQDTRLFKESSKFSFLDNLPTFDTDYIRNCVMLYDYINQRIYVSNHNHEYSFVYSLKTKMWGMINTQITKAINSYPEAFGVIYDSGRETHIIADFNQEITNTIYSQYLITRPIKVEHPDKLKTISSITQRGYFEHTAFKEDGLIKEGDIKVRQILYGSRDLKNWAPVWSSYGKHMRGFAGTPYKYFRIVVITTLTKDEYLEGCTIEYDLRQTNMLH